MKKKKIKSGTMMNGKEDKISKYQRRNKRERLWS